MRKTILAFLSVFAFATGAAPDETSGDADSRGEPCASHLESPNPKYDSQNLQTLTAQNAERLRREKAAANQARALEKAELAARQKTETERVQEESGKQLVETAKTAIDRATSEGRGAVVIDLNAYIGGSKLESKSTIFDGYYNTIEDKGYGENDSSPPPFGNIRYKEGTHRAMDALVQFCKSHGLQLSFYGFKYYSNHGNLYGDSEFPAFDDMRFDGYMHEGKISWTATP